MRGPMIVWLDPGNQHFWSRSPEKCVAPCQYVRADVLARAEERERALRKEAEELKAALAFAGR
jgi:hypothetical protein